MVYRVFRLYFEGQVALIIGTLGLGPAVEVYSPDGKCQHQLANIPIEGSTLRLPTIAYIDGKILSCAGFSVWEVSLRE